MIRRLLIVLTFVATAGLVNADTASAIQLPAKQTYYYCRVDNSVPRASSTKSYADACLKHLREAGFRGLTFTRFERCSRKDDCLFGTAQVNITAERLKADGTVETLGFIAITSKARK